MPINTEVALELGNGLRLENFCGTCYEKPDLLILKSILLRTQKELREGSYRASFCCFENTYAMNRTFLEIRMLNVPLLRFQKEMRNMVVNTGGRVMLVTKKLARIVFFCWLEGRICKWRARVFGWGRFQAKCETVSLISPCCSE